MNLNSPPTEFVFPSAYGGAVKSEKPPQIHDMMRALRIEIGAVEAKKSQDKFGPKFPVRGAKDLAQKLANALNTLNMEAPVIAQEITHIKTDEIPDNKRPNGGPVFRTLAHVKSTVRLIAPDTSFIDLVGSGHGGDVDDKSGGKASTYAWKDALLKGLSIPHEDMVDTDDDSSTGGGEPSSSRAKAAPSEATRRKNAAKEQRGRGTAAVVVSEDDDTVGDAVATEAVSRDLDDSTETDEKGLAYVLAKIEAAESQLDLDQIRDAVKSGVLALHGTDRLAATKAFMERKKALIGRALSILS